MIPFTAEHLANALRFGWESAHRTRTPAGIDRYWEDLGDRIHGMQLLIGTLDPETPEDDAAQRELQSDLELLAGIASYHRTGVEAP